MKQPWGYSLDRSFRSLGRRNHRRQMLTHPLCGVWPNPLAIAKALVKMPALPRALAYGARLDAERCGYALNLGLEFGGGVHGLG